MASAAALLLTLCAVLAVILLGCLVACFRRHRPIARLRHLAARCPLRLLGTSKLPACRCLAPLFFAGLYLYLVSAYYLLIYPRLDLEFPHARAMKLLSLLATPWPAVLFAVFQLADPGEILPTNIRSYLARYPPDGVLYAGACVDGAGVPVVPRSRLCARTQRVVAKYDHYCPWIAQPIGERTLRLFLLFLIACIGVAVVGCAGFSAFFWARVRIYANLTPSRVLLFAGLVAVDHWHELAAWALTAGFAVVLLAFLLMLCVQCSRGETAMEGAQRREWEKRNPGKRFVNAYDMGFVANWKAVLFPAPVATHAPFRPTKKAE